MTERQKRKFINLGSRFMNECVKMENTREKLSDITLKLNKHLDTINIKKKYDYRGYLNDINENLNKIDGKIGNIKWLIEVFSEFLDDEK